MRQMTLCQGRGFVRNIPRLAGVQSICNCMLADGSKDLTEFESLRLLRSDVELNRNAMQRDRMLLCPQKSVSSHMSLKQGLHERIVG